MMNFIENNNDNFAITIKNSGGYMAEFYVDYQIGSAVYKLDSGAFSLGFSRTLNIPKNAEQVYLVVEIWIFGGERILAEDYISTDNHCFNLVGTIFDANMNKIACNLIGDSGSSDGTRCRFCCRRKCCKRVNRC